MLIDDDPRYRTLLRHHISCDWPDVDLVSYNPRVQYSTALASWTNAVAGQPGGTPVVITEDNDFFGAGIDRVTVKIPRALAAPGTTLFGRLRADVP